jgi:hypothetical protein
LFCSEADHQKTRRKEMLDKLKIDPEFEKVLPPIALAEFVLLEDNILADGQITTPIAVWNGAIVDGHNRFKILQKHPYIPYTIKEMNFENRYEAIAWMCNQQLGRRNLRPEYFKYLIGRRYSAEKQSKQLRNEKGMFAPGGHDDHTDDGLKTSERIAQEIGKSERYVRRAEDFADGLDIADEIIPGTKKKVLNGEVKVQHWDVESLRLSALDDRPEKVKSMFNKDAQPYDERKTTEMIIDGPLHGAILQLVGSLGNYFARFPMIMSDENFRKDVRAEFEQLKKYIAEFEDFLDEGERKSQANIPDSNGALPQINTDL